MPKVIHTNAKGLFQESGSGVHFQSTSNRMALWTKTEKITDDGDGVRTLTVAESGTCFIIDDAALVLTLPTPSTETIGTRYKFILADEDATAFVIKTGTDNSVFWSGGYAVINKSAAKAASFVADGDSNSKITLNGTTTGGLVTGATGDSNAINEITITGVASSGGAWFCEYVGQGSGTLATPFADQ
tara:strand:- start:7331 stop:7891 length:561 start_codon:yes stop_codon:yes gene_type:complete